MSNTKESTMKGFQFKQVLAGIVLASVISLMNAFAGIAAEFVSVNNDDVNLRSGPGTKYSVLYELPAGYPLKVVSRKGEWLKVSDFENDQGWIYTPLVSQARYVIVTVKEGNVRSGPGVNTDKVGTVSREVILKQVKREGDWIKVAHPKLNGWVHRKLVWP